MTPVEIQQIRKKFAKLNLDNTTQLRAVFNQNNGNIQYILSESNTNSSIPIDTISFCTKGFGDQDQNSWSWISKAGDIELQILDPETDPSLSKPPCTPSNLMMIQFTKSGSETGGCRWFGIRSFPEFLNKNLTISFYYKFDYIDGYDIQNRGGLKIAQRIVGTAWIDKAYDCIDNWCYYELSFVYDWAPKIGYIFVFKGTSLFREFGTIDFHFNCAFFLLESVTV